MQISLQRENRLKQLGQAAQKAYKVVEFKKRLKEVIKQKKNNKVIMLSNIMIQAEKINRKYEDQHDQLLRIDYQLKHIREDKLSKKEKINKEKQDVKRAKQQLQSKIQQSQQIVEQLVLSISERQKQIQSYKQQIQVIITQTNNLKTQKTKLKKYIYDHQLIYQNNLKIVQQKFQEKTKLNNQYQQKRGNIRVYCRIRPFIANQLKQPIHEVISDNCLKINVPGFKHKSQNTIKSQIFNFDQIFDQRQKQQQVFQQIVQLMHSAVDGKNVCIFAYGQTGSGKTFTMLGEGEPNSENQGIIPRSIRLVFQQIERAKDRNWIYRVFVEIKEVYLQNIINLLKNEKKQKNNQNIEVDKKHQVTCDKQVEILFQEAQNIRKSAGTNCNERSSRSHLIFSLQLCAYNSKTLVAKKGSLNLIDLAGTQRVQQSKAEGERFKEARSINSSLSHLGDVISALLKRQSHIPFRNSKLTHLLQENLSGDSKTLMFVNISPRSQDYNQTIASLRFAEKVKSCKINS